MRVRVNVDINRPIDTVFDYLADPGSCVDWLGGFTESIAVEPGGLRVGAQSRQTVKFLGRNFKIATDVVELQPNRAITMRVASGLFPMTWRHELSEVGGQTRVTTTLEAEAGSYFKVVGPVLKGVVKRHLADDQGQLKALLEAQEILVR